MNLSTNSEFRTREETGGPGVGIGRRGLKIMALWLVTQRLDSYRSTWSNLKPEDSKMSKVCPIE